MIRFCRRVEDVCVRRSCFGTHSFSAATSIFESLTSSSIWLIFELQAMKRETLHETCSFVLVRGGGLVLRPEPLRRFASGEVTAEIQELI